MSTLSTDISYRYCGRIFSDEEMSLIRRLIDYEPKRNRSQLSKLVCDELAWLRQDGRRKDMSCRVAMLRMHRDGLIKLPPPRHGNGNGRTRPQLTGASNPQKPISLPVNTLAELIVRPVHTRKDSSLWNELIERYHYLGYKPLPGAQMRYLVFAGTHLLAALGFGAAAWKTAPRDNFIGWTAEVRVRNLHLIVNNARFLILPGLLFIILLLKYWLTLLNVYLMTGKPDMVISPSSWKLLLRKTAFEVPAIVQQTGFMLEKLRDGGSLIETTSGYSL